MASTSSKVRLLRGARLCDGRGVDVAVDEVTGIVAGVRPIGASAPESPQSPQSSQSSQSANGPTGATIDWADGPTDIDLHGYLLLPAAAEPHAHLDKALTADLVPNPRGDLSGAISAWLAFSRTVTVDDMVRRGRTAALELLANGVTAIRTHTNVGPRWFDAVQAMLQLRDELHEVMTIQVVALTTIEICGGERAYRQTIDEALSMGGSVLVGGCPHLDENPTRAIDVALELAGIAGRALDLHMDEQLDPNILTVRHLAQRVIDTGFAPSVAASHCVSLGVQPLDIQRAVAASIAESGVRVVTLPQTNLYLQGREHLHSIPRGLTALRPLIDAGVTVAAGGDNVRDPFNLMGRNDPFETAALLVAAGHLGVDEAVATITTGSRETLDLPAAGIVAGAAADLMAVRGTGLGDVVARGDHERMVWHQGRLVAATTVTRSFPALTRQECPAREPAVPPTDRTAPPPAPAGRVIS